MHFTYAAIEAGGTKFNVALLDERGDVLCSRRVATTKPSETLSQCLSFIRESAETLCLKVCAMGIAGFGPICVDRASPHFGEIMNTPKPFWSGVNLYQYFHDELKIPVAVDSDVNAAALAEYAQRAEQGNLVYITVGTGVGVGVCLAGQTLQGRLHPELGHLRCAVLDNEAAGVCATHGNCIEGLASGPALKARWKVALEDTRADHPLWESTAHYLAEICMAATLAYSPFQIVIGGGVMASGHVLTPLRRHYKRLMAGYLPDIAYPRGMDEMISLPSLNDAPGLIGAWLAAKELYCEN